MPSYSRNQDIDPSRGRGVSGSCLVHKVQRSVVQVASLVSDDETLFATHGEEELVVNSLAPGVFIETVPQCFQQFNITMSLGFIRRILVVDIQPIQPVVFQQPDRRFYEFGTV